MILSIIKTQLGKIYGDNIVLDKSETNEKYIHWTIEEDEDDYISIRVEIDNEDHDWYVEELMQNLEWKKVGIITL